jgi:hypothetical protein
VTVLELRQYTLTPGRRDALIELFERELIAPQERAGMQIIGTFRDLADAQRFVWIRGFPDMERRAESLAAFYGGPVWRRHRNAANATMVDTDNVLLLRPAPLSTNFTRGPQTTVAVEEPALVQVVIVPFAEPVDDDGLTYFSDVIEPMIEASGGRMLACLVSEHAANTFPALPVREGENVLVWLAGVGDLQPPHASPEGLSELSQALGSWPGVLGPPEVRHLAPTRSSRLTGSSVTGYVPARLARSSA